MFDIIVSLIILVCAFFLICSAYNQKRIPASEMWVNGALLSIILICSFVFTVKSVVKYDPTVDTPTIVSPGQETDIESDGWAVSDYMPVYRVSLKETPVESMWEFTYSLQNTNAVTIGTIQANYNNDTLDYEVVFRKEPSLLSSDYNYYLVLTNVYQDQNLCYSVTEDTVDTQWALMTTLVEKYNLYIEEINKNHYDIESTKYSALFDYICNTTMDYEIRNTNSWDNSRTMLEEFKTIAESNKEQFKEGQDSKVND